MDFSQKANSTSVAKTIKALAANNIEAVLVKDKEQAKQKVLELLPKGAEVFAVSSETLNTLGLPAVINDSGDYQSVRNQLNSLNRETQHLEMNKLGSAPEYVVGSVHAVSEDGKVVIASNTGSQLAPYAYGAAHVIWVVGTQKIVPDFDLALQRIYDYVLPLESARMQKLHGVPSVVSKLLVFNREFRPGRISMILVDEVLGF